MLRDQAHNSASLLDTSAHSRRSTKCSCPCLMWSCCIKPVSTRAGAVADELGQHIHEQRKLQAQLQTTKSLKDQKVSTQTAFHTSVCVHATLWQAKVMHRLPRHCKVYIPLNQTQPEKHTHSAPSSAAVYATYIIIIHMVHYTTACPGV